MQETTNPPTAQATEAGRQLALFPDAQQQSLLIAQWAATWTTFLQRDAYREQEEREPPDSQEQAAA